MDQGYARAPLRLGLALAPFFLLHVGINAECVSSLWIGFRRHADPHLFRAKQPSQLPQLPRGPFLI